MNEEPEYKPKLSVALDGIVRFIGELTSWLCILLVAAIIVQVILRYVFGHGLVVLEELQWHFYGIMIMIAIPYGVITDAHIRLDLLHSRFSQRTKEKVEILGIIFLLLPLIIVIFIHSLDFVADSWRVNERSDAPMGLCCRWAFKSFIPISMGLMVIAVVSRLVRAVAFLKKSRVEESE